MCRLDPSDPMSGLDILLTQRELPRAWEEDKLFWCRNWDIRSTTDRTQVGSVNTASWQNLQPTGNIVNFGSVVDAASSDIMSFTPTAVVIQGITCKIVAAPTLQS